MEAEEQEEATLDPIKVNLIHSIKMSINHLEINASSTCSQKYINHVMNPNFQICENLRATNVLINAPSILYHEEALN